MNVPIWVWAFSVGLILAALLGSLRDAHAVAARPAAPCGPPPSVSTSPALFTEKSLAVDPDMVPMTLSLAAIIGTSIAVALRATPGIASATRDLDTEPTFTTTGA